MDSSTPVKDYHFTGKTRHRYINKKLKTGKKPSLVCGKPCLYIYKENKYHPGYDIWDFEKQAEKIALQNHHLREFANVLLVGSFEFLECDYHVYRQMHYISYLLESLITY